MTNAEIFALTAFIVSLANTAAITSVGRRMYQHIEVNCRLRTEYAKRLEKLEYPPDGYSAPLNARLERLEQQQTDSDALAGDIVPPPTISTSSSDVDHAPGGETK